MTKNQIIELIYKDQAYINICRQICSSNKYSDHLDLFHEVITILLLKNDVEIQNAYDAKFIKFLFIRIANNQYCSKTSPFHLKYRGKLECTSVDNLSSIELIDNTSINERTYNDLSEKVLTHLESLKEYDRELFKVWVSLGMSSAEVSRKTGIDQQNISKKILKIRKQLSETYGNDFNSIYDTE